MKFSDDAHDIAHNNQYSIALGVICALCAGIATVFDVGAAYIFIAILIGNLLAFKVDGIHHIVTLILFVVICLLFGIPQLNLGIVLLCIFAALLDEVGHETISNITDNQYCIFFFEYRFAMKVIIFILALCGVFNIVTFIFFMLFELSYEFAGVVYKNLE